MARRTVIAGGFAAALLAGAAFAQTATLPTEWTGPWKFGEPPAGWVFAGLGEDALPDYDGINDGAAKLDGSGDFISIDFDVPPASVSFWIRGLTFSGGVFRVEQSADGTQWTELAAYAPPPTNATFQTLTPSLRAQRIRFIYSQKDTGNVGIDGISIAPSPFFVIQSVSTTGGVGRVRIVKSIAGRLYGLQHTTNLVGAPVPWLQVSTSEGNGGELELLDPVFNPPRFYRVLDVTPPADGRRGAAPAPAAPAGDRPLWR